MKFMPIEETGHQKENLLEMKQGLGWSKILFLTIKQEESSWPLERLVIFNIGHTMTSLLPSNINSSSSIIYRCFSRSH